MPTRISNSELELPTLADTRNVIRFGFAVACVFSRLLQYFFFLFFIIYFVFGAERVYFRMAYNTREFFFCFRLYLVRSILYEIFFYFLW